MKLALVNPESRFGDPPLGLAYLAAYIRNKYSSIQIKIIDKENEINAIKKFNPDLIGVSVVSETFYEANQLAEKIKKIYKNPLIVGGIHVTICPQDFEKSNFDIAILGEGEQTLFELVKEFEKNGLEDKKELKKVKGLLFKDNGKIIKTEQREFFENLDDVPLPARDLLDMDFYNQVRITPKRELKVIGSMMTSRGCPFNCSFCSTSLFWRNRVRFHSPERVIEEIKFLLDKYKVETINIYDDLFMINKARVKKIADLIEKGGLNKKVEFWMQARADVLDEELVKDLKRMNVCAMAFGFESNSEKILKELKGPHTKVENNQKAVDLCNKYGIAVEGLFIVGSPYETEKEMMKTYDFIKNNNLSCIAIYQAYPFPGTRLFDYAVKNNIMPFDFFIKPHPRLWLSNNSCFITTREISKERFQILFKKFQDLAKEVNTRKKVNFATYKNFRHFFHYKFLKRNIYVRIKRLSEKLRKKTYE